MGRVNTLPPSLGNRGRLLEHGRAVSDALLDARDELSPLQLHELLRWMVGLCGELDAAIAQDVAGYAHEIKQLRRALELAPTSPIDAVDLYRLSARLAPLSVNARSLLDTLEGAA